MRWASLCSWIQKSWLAFLALVLELNGAEPDTENASAGSAGAGRGEIF